jgi:hypothetical protein
LGVGGRRLSADGADEIHPKDIMGQSQRHKTTMAAGAPQNGLGGDQTSPPNTKFPLRICA